MHLTLHLTGRCNLRCSYCYEAPHKGGDMTVETMRSAVEFARTQAQEAGCEKTLGISFYGGEPLLMRELISETISYCDSITAKTGELFHFKITTNGILLDEDFLTDRNTGRNLVALSHDGICEAHDRHRIDHNGFGTFSKLHDIAVMLIKLKPFSPVMLTVTPETVNHYYDSVQYLYECGFRYIIATLDFSGNWDKKSFKILGRQYKLLADWYEKEILKESKFYFSPFDTKIATRISLGSCRHGRCDFGKRQISVAPNGRLYPCVQFVGDATDDKYCVGDVFSGLDIEKHTELYSENNREKPECAKCALKERCNHFCGCLNWQITGELMQVAPSVCAHERTLISIADRLAAKLYKRRNALFIQKHYNEAFPFLSLLEETIDS